MHGSNERESYVDLEAVRVCLDEPAGHAGILQEAWERYHLPLALTEVHLGGHREQQLRWWLQAWNQAVKLREAGTDVRAITAWSMLGSFNWHNLVTRDDGLYESGVFDIRSPTPRPTLLARAIEATTQNRSFEHPVVDAPGWWQSERRLLYPPVQLSAVAHTTPASRISKKSRPLLITGANGTLGQAFQRICTSRDISFHAVSRTELDIANVEQVRQVLSESRPWAVINSAGYVRVDDAEREPDICVRANVIGPAILAELCAEQHIPLLSFSSDLVFNGEQTSPYLESDTPAPLNTYGLSKAEAEARIMEANEQALLIRTSAFFGPWDSANFLMQVARSIALHQEFYAAEDVLVSPTYVPDLVHASLDLLIDGESGIWHLANQGEVSWFDFAHQFIHAAGLNDACLRSAPLEVLPFMAARPRYSVLSSERGQLLPPLEEAISQFVQAAGQVKS
jgi:dTDP-4-dehydrorhamnose reductase